VKQKRVGNRLNSGETERKRNRDRERCLQRVLVWAINLAVGQIFMTARERIIRDLIKINMRIIFKNLDGIILLCWVL
jgi:hypothetical protein